MEWFWESVHLVVTLDAMVVTIVFVAGALIAPIAILVRSTCFWRRRLKWAAVAAVTSWFGLWLFWRDEARRIHNHTDRSGVRLA